MKKLKGLFLVAMLLLAACSGSGGDGDSSDKSDEAKRPEWARPVDEITGTITVYTTMEETQQEALKEIWNDIYPNSKIEIQTDSLGTLATRIRSDEKNDADVIVGGLFQADGDTYHDILEKYTSPLDEEQGDYVDPNGYYTYYDVQVMSLVVNPKLAEDLGVEIKGYKDLLDKKLKGKIILAAPDATSSGWRQVQTMLAVMGDEFDDGKAWEYIEQLMPQAFSTTSSKDVYNLVTNGEYVVGLSYESTVDALIRDGAPIENVYMVEGNTAMATAGAIVKDAPNKDAAEAMMDLLASREFQDIRAERSSGRGTNVNSKLVDLPEEKELNLTKLDFDYLIENKAKIMDRWNTLWNETH
ncbi:MULTISPECIES: extracellular solute-binding protein [unclassified Breznakia]|uniref:extracellular solute-binding protein n=1 Tax=unclassified Breznakia TaxID=2623764 RepID=UPI0024754777|nr:MULTISPECIES: extracellular solute-binding protein [unclassified Breznakia]MDH6367344.1 iron(III) transport system substrate-binding protein [Breznakia sp. PH1-1]MDH6404508.1 iron(III) transport system substrate-binding protein [Breznakia sp. PF1-11]MDH6412217.1 iron(III) transport system substrate-binding protein [Breznakia sp. PFB1-11]MDH6414511.1 iron(III) transport system substrate-binding protein [Breznakia sp. PFB1-14]MDH6416881.1 iron(III) transport system substrate-binding protein [